jgi:hypothetical protein
MYGEEMAGTGEKTTGNSTWIRFDLDELTKLTTVLAAFAYATGVIAISTYLRELGIVDFSFAKPKLLLTGIMAIFTFLLLATPPCLLAWALASRHGHSRRTPPSLLGIVASVFIFFGVLLGASALLCFTNNSGLGQVTVLEVWKLIRPQSLFLLKATVALIIAVEVYLPVFGAALFVYVATRLFDKAKLEESKPGISLRWFYFATAVAIVAISGILYIFIFTRTFYAAIPQQFGGGKPYYESFAIANQYKCQLEQLGMPFSQPYVTASLPVLYETDTVVAVWLRAADDKKGLPRKDGAPETRGWTYVIAALDKNQINATMVGQDRGAEPPQLLSPQPCKSGSN